MPRGPVRRPSRSTCILVNTSAPSSKSKRAGVLKSEPASFRYDKWSYLRATGIGCRGRSLVTFFSMSDTWNHMEPRVHVLAPATPSTLAIFSVILVHLHLEPLCELPPHHLPLQASFVIKLSASLSTSSKVMVMLCAFLAHRWWSTFLCHMPFF